MQPQSEGPDFHQRKAMWDTIDFKQVETSTPRVEQFLKEMRPIYSNGEVEFASFIIPSHPVFEWYMSRRQFHEMGFFERFWKAKGPREAFPYDLQDFNFFDQRHFSFLSPFHLGGSLAWMLSSGGPYTHFSCGGIEAKRIGEEAASEMLAGDYDGNLAFQCGTAWCDFFFDVARDHTFLVVDPVRRLIHVLLATDTD